MRGPRTDLHLRALWAGIVLAQVCHYSIRAIQRTGMRILARWHHWRAECLADAYFHTIGTTGAWDDSLLDEANRHSLKREAILRHMEGLR